MDALASGAPKMIRKYRRSSVACGTQRSGGNQHSSAHHRARRAAPPPRHRLPIPRAKPTARRRRNSSGEWRAGACEERRLGHVGRDRRSCSCQHHGSTSGSHASPDPAPQLAVAYPRGSWGLLHCRGMGAMASGAQKATTKYLRPIRGNQQRNCSHQYHGSTPGSRASSGPAPQLAAGYPRDAQSLLHCRGMDALASGAPKMVR